MTVKPPTAPSTNVHNNTDVDIDNDVRNKVGIDIDLDNYIKNYLSQYNNQYQSLYNKNNNQATGGSSNSSSVANGGSAVAYGSSSNVSVNLDVDSLTGLVRDYYQLVYSANDWTPTILVSNELNNLNYQMNGGTMVATTGQDVMRGNDVASDTFVLSGTTPFMNTVDILLGVQAQDKIQLNGVYTDLHVHSGYLSLNGNNVIPVNVLMDGNQYVALVNGEVSVVV